MKNKKIAFRTLGCRLNQYETDAIASQFNRNNYEVVYFNEPADIYVINTCTVTNQADQKSKQEIHKALKKGENPLVVVTGCMADNYKDSPGQFQQVDYLIDNAHKTSLFHIVNSHVKEKKAETNKLLPDIFGFEPAGKTYHTRSWIKIQDGCNRFCIYCIVPKVRGREASRPVKNIISNIEQVLEFGFKEIVLTGVNIGRYNYEGTDFEHLIAKILDISGNFRVRISSIEPEGFGDILYELFSHPKLTKHLHLCVQSGSDRILRQMRRFYSINDYLKIIEKLKNKYPLFNFTTDIIVGFPDETEKDFQQSANIAREVGFSHIHTFKYSIRDGTKAAAMKNQIPEKVKNERSNYIRNISNHNKIKYRRSLLGKEQIVLVERINTQEFARGYGELYVPVEFKSPDNRINEFYAVKLRELKSKDNPVILADTVALRQK